MGKEELNREELRRRVEYEYSQNILNVGVGGPSDYVLLSLDK